MTKLLVVWIIYYKENHELFGNWSDIVSQYVFDGYMGKFSCGAQYTYVSSPYLLLKLKIYTYSWFDRSCLSQLCQYCVYAFLLCCVEFYIQFWWNCLFKLLMSSHAAHKKSVPLRSWGKRGQKNDKKINYKCHFFLDILSLFLLLLIFHMPHLCYFFLSLRL